MVLVSIRNQILCASLAGMLAGWMLAAPCDAQNRPDTLVLNLPRQPAEFGTLMKVAPKTRYWDDHMRGEKFARLTGRVAIQADTQLAVIVDDTLSDPFPTLQQLPIENVYSVSLSGSTFVTDQTIQKLLRFKNLRRLQIDRTELSDAGLIPLKGLTHLEFLDVSRTRVTGNTLSSLTALKELRHIRMDSNALDGTKLSPLSRLPRLEWLSIRHSRLRDPHLEFMQHSKQIRLLELCGNHLLTNKCMRYLAKLPKLDVIMVNGTSIGFAGLCELKSCPLTSIKVSANTLTAAEFAKLKEIFPRSKIRVDDGPAKSYRLFKELLD